MAHAPAYHRPILVVVALVVTNLVLGRVLPDPLYVPFALTVAAALTVYALRGDGRRLGDLGWDVGSARSGLRWGLAFAATVALIYAIGAALPATRPLFEDSRVADLDGQAVAYRALVRVPLGTVTLEEVAFRSVLLAMLLVRTSTRRAVAGSSLLFGVWHVLPALGTADVNPIFEDHFGDGVAGTVLVVTGGVIATAVAGVFMCWLRLRTGSLLPVILLHWATNGLGYLVAWLVLQS